MSDLSKALRRAEKLAQLAPEQRYESDEACIVLAQEYLALAARATFPSEARAANAALYGGAPVPVEEQ